MRWSLVIGILVFGLWSLVVGCASGDDDDDASADDDTADDASADDDTADDASADDDATDDDAGDPTSEQCELIWAGCEADFPIDPTDAGCGSEPEFDPQDWEEWAEWEDCMNAALGADYSALDACGYDVGCNDEHHDLYSCKAALYDSLGDCAVETAWTPRQECLDQKTQESWCADA